MTIPKALIPCLSLLFTGCPGVVDNMALKRILPAALERGDIGEACALGEGLAAAVQSMETKNRSPEKALTIIGIASAICFEQRAQTADLNEASVRALWMGTPKGLTAITDARLAKQRTHTRAAERYGRVWGSFNKLYPKHATECPKLSAKEEPAYLIGLLSGLLAVLHDGTGGRNAGISQDVVLQAGRAARCLDNEKWWNIPSAMEAASWACIPGSGPTDVDPWKTLQTLGASADDQGMRLASALYVTVAANAGREEDVKTGVMHAAQSRTSHQTPHGWALLDNLAFSLMQHESDLIWFRDAGHRTETLGDFPSSEEPESTPDNPFEDDPFGSD